MDGSADPPPLTPEQLAEAVALYRELQAARQAGVRLAIVTIRRDGFAVGYVSPRLDIQAYNKVNIT